MEKIEYALNCLFNSGMPLIAKEAQQELTTIKQLLKSIEWQYREGLHYCPACGGVADNKGHKPDCQLAKYIIAGKETD